MCSLFTTYCSASHPKDSSFTTWKGPDGFIPSYSFHTSIPCSRSLMVFRCECLKPWLNDAMHAWPSSISPQQRNNHASTIDLNIPSSCSSSSHHRHIDPYMVLSLAPPFSHQAILLLPEPRPIYQSADTIRNKKMIFTYASSERSLWSSLYRKVPANIPYHTIWAIRGTYPDIIDKKKAYKTSISYYMRASTHCFGMAWSI